METFKYTWANVSTKDLAQQNPSGDLGKIVLKSLLRLSTYALSKLTRPIQDYVDNQNQAETHTLQCTALCFEKKNSFAKWNNLELNQNSNAMHY